ncbi:hypothetical protein T440DRAFT_506251 [Plenodomus tracheiphilus IPT5]|uniref:RRM domain-containing protein n=1 Tax=Plenodomus tracheiphilus IPT5 TaxID=1408161 RepID=A0A6A7BBP9_9PLEO|nr:hypothetical protein T440DRAFT_506251 [Plenodomus tracheiphilus IPT5]
MADSVSFASFVKDAREKKKNEVLAQQFLGRGRKTAASGAGLSTKSRADSQKPSLLSRISGAGVQKRSTSAKPNLQPSTSIDGKWQHDLHKLNNPNGPPPAGGRNANARLNRTASASQVDRNSRAYDKFASVLNKSTSARSAEAGGFSIRGVASGGPYTVIASNFALGTTAADIEAVMSPVGGETLGCKLISASPTVMVELQFADKQGAENVVATFNNQKADGRLLYVYMKDVPATTHLAHSRPPPARLAQSADDMDMDVDTNAGARAGSFQDGRFGFNESGRRDPPRGPRRRY